MRLSVFSHPDPSRQPASFVTTPGFSPALCCPRWVRAQPALQPTRYQWQKGASTPGPAGKHVRFGTWADKSQLLGEKNPRKVNVCSCWFPILNKLEDVQSGVLHEATPGGLSVIREQDAVAGRSRWIHCPHRAFTCKRSFYIWRQSSEVTWLQTGSLRQREIGQPAHVTPPISRRDKGNRRPVLAPVTGPMAPSLSLGQGSRLLPPPPLHLVVPCSSYPWGISQPCLSPCRHLAAYNNLLASPPSGLQRYLWWGTLPAGCCCLLPAR